MPVFSSNGLSVIVALPPSAAALDDIREAIARGEDGTPLEGCIWGPIRPSTRASCFRGYLESKRGHPPECLYNEKEGQTIAGLPPFPGVTLAGGGEGKGLLPSYRRKAAT